MTSKHKCIKHPHDRDLIASSWVICNKLTGKAVFETTQKDTADAFRDTRSPYKAVPILEYLQSLNS